MAHKIIQWNCRGLRSNYNDLAILLQEHSPPGYSSAGTQPIGCVPAGD